MTRRKRPAPPTYMQPTYPPKFPGKATPVEKKPSPSKRAKEPSEADKGARSASERLSNLQKLGELHASGVLNDQEFEREKRRLLE
ncbi:hypothetical protein KDH_04140 [Dictyobacter sp. S3.2.2.5]|uniref:SHOCT domain-containing protein n=1 Tax=Dictyobacter halimunensis TaxID=3026934 RepID=A0ABQ6FIY0_9CHLR|nr:hypothetical protein KDH_04140 [Dictyobacter sp. S3.2.2.5]